MGLGQGKADVGLTLGGDGWQGQQQGSREIIVPLCPYAALGLFL